MNEETKATVAIFDGALTVACLFILLIGRFVSPTCDKFGNKKSRLEAGFVSSMI